MINHSISHGAVSLATLVGAQLLADKIASHLPSFYTWIEALSAWILDWFDFPMLQSQMELLLVAALMGMLWGIIFWHLAAERVVR